jgi:carboxylesterase type B
MQRSRYNTSSNYLSDVVNTWGRGGYIEDIGNDNFSDNNSTRTLPVRLTTNKNSRVIHSLNYMNSKSTGSNALMSKIQEKINALKLAKEEHDLNRARQRAARRAKRLKERALKDAAKVVVDYRPVMSRIVDDYLFRCPSWHFAQSISERREKRGVVGNVFVYRFSQPTHIPGYKECWGKVCPCHPSLNMNYYHKEVFFSVLTECMV